ncbi:tonB-system energizer ExbB [Hyphomicrobium sp. NDB2Meth4]|uniref:tonB-system energizer ExbB n=1 Tax=Hyphomicrobium sp. NDB2Meth4 TaxID=1892846 RepID=UPI0009F9DF02|nr:tonB-system energizer ExbB [Hyphomicrobium sp. NDB2Meth4]
MRNLSIADTAPRFAVLLLVAGVVCFPAAAQVSAPAAPAKPAEVVTPVAPAQPEAAPPAEATENTQPLSMPEAQSSASSAPAVAAPAEANPPGTDAATAAAPSSSPMRPAADVTPLALGTPSATDAAPVSDTEGSAAAPAPKDSTPLPHNLSPWGMFQAADIVVKAVMIGLAFASFATWTVWLAKAFELALARRRLRRADRSLRAAATLNDAFDAIGKMRGTGPHLVREAVDEMRASEALLDHGSASGIKERVTSRLSRAEADAGRRLTLGTGVLATIGATAPFVGLFGTVWGIMNAFIGISETQTTNLAVVAPGIAEALLATAIGLVAAIPAVIIYNAFARSIAGYRLQLANASAAIERLVSRDIDLRRLPGAPVVKLALAAE